MSQTAMIETALAVMAVLAIGLAVWSLRRVAGIRRDLLVVRGVDGEASILEAIASQLREIDVLKADIESLKQALAIAQRDVSAALRHVAVVRFDAFGDMGGRMSFSAAMLDDHGDGVLLTSIHGHTESRMYVKTVSARTVSGRLSPEELEAITTASPVM